MKLIRYSHPMANQFGDMERLFSSSFEGLGNLSRLLDLRQRAEAKTEAPLEDGILTLRLPVSEASKPKRIAVE